MKVFIRPEDVVLSNEKCENSTRNVFMGTVIGIYDFGALTHV